MKTELSRNYISILHDGSPSFGGSQNWFSGMFKVCGCSLIGAADLLWYLARRKAMSFPQYQRYVGKLRRSFPMIPYRGIPGYLMPVFLNLFMLRKKIPYRARWGAGPDGIIKCVHRMLAEDIPVPVCVGACLHQFFNKPPYRGLKLYKKNSGSGEPYRWDKTVRNHFMVITAIDGKWARVSSWGQEYYIDLTEYVKLSRWDLFGVFTNIIRISSLSGSL